MNYPDFLGLFFSFFMQNADHLLSQRDLSVNLSYPQTVEYKLNNIEITPFQTINTKNLRPISNTSLGLDKPIKPLDRNEFKPNVNYKPNSKFSMLGSDNTWDIQGSLNFLKRSAAPKSMGQCAKSIRLALAQGGVNIRAVPSAKLLGNSLLSAGFEEIPSTASPIAGDIVVIQPYPGSIDGHSAMFDGSIWISDFKQQTLYPGVSYLLAKPPYQFYRKK